MKPVKKPIFNKELGIVIIDKRLLKTFLPRLQELSKTKKSWYWFYQCVKHDNHRKMRKAIKSFWKAYHQEKEEE